MSKESHQFSTDAAKKVGVNAAIIFGHLIFLHKANLNRADSWDGFRYWIKKTARAFEAMYPYLSQKEIRGALDRLQKDGYILSVAGLSENKFDRAKSFSIEQLGFDLYEIAAEERHVFACDKRANGRLPKGKSDVTQRANAYSYNPYKENNIGENANEYAFLDFWNDYDYKVGSKKKAQAAFEKLKPLEREQIRDTLAMYKVDTVTKEVTVGPWKKKRKEPEFYLSGKMWEAYAERLAAQKAENETFAPEWSEVYAEYLGWVERCYPKSLKAAKYLSKQQYVRYKTTFYVEGKSYIDEKREREFLIQAHDDVEKNDDLRARVTDIFAYHCELIKERLKMYQI